MVTTAYAVCAPGVSLTAEQIHMVVDAGLPIVAGGDAIRLTHQHAVALAASDAAWWRQYPEWVKWPGPKFTLAPDHARPDGVIRLQTGMSGTNTALLAVQVARHLGATHVLLLGVDLHSPGEHFFGRHPASLRSSTAKRFDVFRRQFGQYQARDMTIINCAPGSALDCYRKRDLEEVLRKWRPSASNGG